MNNKILKIVSVFIAFFICFPLHFLYDKFPSFLTSIFAPVNESIWEHMKLLFGSIILTGIIQKIFLQLKKQHVNNICFSNYIAALTSIPIFLILFLPIYSIIGHNMIVTLAIMFITISIAEIISYIIMNKKDFQLEKITIFFAIGIYIVFATLTYHPLKNNLFICPTNKTYGIEKGYQK